MPLAVSFGGTLHPLGPALIALHHLRNNELRGVWFWWEEERLQFLNSFFTSATNAKLHAVIWKMALLRVSSRPVDMVLSIMQILGVTLDPQAFHADDRIGATIALAQGLLKKYDGQPIWLSGIFNFPPSPHSSMFSREIDEDERKKALDYHHNSQSGESEILRYSEIYPKGTLDDEGYFTFVPDQVFPITMVEGSEKYGAEVGIKAIDGTYWDVSSTDARPLGEMANETLLAVKVIREYDRIAKHDSKSGYFVVQMHAPGKYHRVTQFWDSYGRFEQKNSSKRVVDWGEDRTISVGGPVPYKKPDLS